MFDVAALKAAHDRFLTVLHAQLGVAVELARFAVEARRDGRWPYYRKALRARTRSNRDGWVLTIGANKTKPHRIVARNAKALRFMSGGALVFRKSVFHPGSLPKKPALESVRLANKSLDQSVPAAMARAAR